MKQPWVGVGCVAFVLTLTACGGGGSSKTSATLPSKSSTSASTSPSTSPSTTAPTTTSAADSAADEALARSLVLVPGDFPAGWTASAHVDDPDDAALGKQLADCTGATDPATASADIDGSDFDNGDAEVNTSVSVAATRADFEQDMAALRSSKYDTCLKQLFDTELRKQLVKDAPGATIDKIDLVRFATPTYGEVTVGQRITMTVSANGQTLNFYGDNISYGKDRSEVNVTFFNIGAPFDPELEQALIAKAAAKLTGAV